MNIKNTGELIDAIEGYSINRLLSGDVIVKTVFYKGRKLFNLNASNKKKAVNKLMAIGRNKPIHIKKHESSKKAGDYNYYREKLHYVTMYIN